MCSNKIFLNFFPRRNWLWLQRSILFPLIITWTLSLKPQMVPEVAVITERRAISPHREFNIVVNNESSTVVSEDKYTLVIVGEQYPRSDVTRMLILNLTSQLLHRQGEEPYLIIDWPSFCYLILFWYSPYFFRRITLCFTKSEILCHTLLSSSI